MSETTDTEPEDCQICRLSEPINGSTLCSRCLSLREEMRKDVNVAMKVLNHILKEIDNNDIQPV